MQSGLFSASVTAFIIESYKSLKPDPLDLAVVYLGAISRNMGAPSDSSMPNTADPSATGDPTPFQTNGQALRVNVYWLLSLSLALVCAFTATLVKQWGRNYLHEIARHPAAYKRARVRAFLFEGIESFRLPAVVNTVPTLLHASLLLFFVGLVEFLYPINRLLGYFFTAFLAIGAVLYGFTIVTPSIFLDCPYQTPLSRMCFLLSRIRHDGWSNASLVGARELAAMDDSPARNSRDERALDWSFRQLNEDHELDPFLQGLKGFVESRKINNGPERVKRFGSELYARVPRMLHAAVVHGNILPGHEGRVIGCMQAIALDASLFVQDIHVLNGIAAVVGAVTGSPSPFAAQAMLTLRTLARAYENVRAQGREPENHLHDVVSQRQEGIVWLLLERGIDVNTQGGKYGNALQAASLNGNEGIVWLLLEKGANVNAQGGKYGNALQAASCKGDEGIVWLLLEKGANVNAQGGWYNSALHAASQCAHEAIVRLLLEKGADVDPQGGVGSALRNASDRGHDVIVKLLLDNGANINAQHGNALQAASSKGHEVIVRLLLEKGADVNAQGGGRQGNALHAASQNGHEVIVQLLLVKGADVNTRGGFYGSALQAASHYGHEGIVQLFLEKGADVNAQGGYYGTALQAASWRGHQVTVQLLLAKGADINAQGGQYKNALQAASISGQAVIIQLLREKGVKEI